MLCAISGEAPQVPVASRKSGNVFERRLIEAYIAENGKDPVTGEELSTDDLVELKTARVVRPRPPTLTSIPALLSTFQNEWDALALETYTLKQQLAQTRQELSTALYQHDAAMRVIARLQRERDEARDALSKVTVSAGGATSNGDAMQVDGQGLPQDIVEKIDATQQKLSSTRRKRPVPEDWATTDTIQAFDKTFTTESLYRSSRCIALDEDGDLALCGGADGDAGVYSLASKKSMSALRCGGFVNDATWWDTKPILATSTGSIKVFDGGAEIATLGSHAGEARGLALHPSGDILASVGVDKSYMLYDLTSMKLLTQTFTDSELICCAFHPDGHLFAAGGTEGHIRLFDVKTGTQAAVFDNSTKSPITHLSFSENGIWLAAASHAPSSVTIWDLRKTAVVKTFDVGAAVDWVAWEYTGQFLAVAGPGGISVQAYEKQGKRWSEPLRRGEPAVAAAWGPGARSLAVLNFDGSVSVMGSA